MLLLASKFFIYWMICLGRQEEQRAVRVFDPALGIIQEKQNYFWAIEVFTQAVENVKPNIQVRSERVGGASY